MIVIIVTIIMTIIPPTQAAQSPYANLTAAALGHGAGGGANARHTR